MSTPLSSPAKELTIYGGIPIFVAGILGDILNVLVFLSLKTFRQSSCGFYLTVMSFVNIIQLLHSLLPRILLALINTDGTDKSLFFCKYRSYLIPACAGISLTCFCMATIDQYFATSTRLRWQQWCNIKLAHRIILIAIIFWCLHGIPYLIFYNHFISPTTYTTTCMNTNYIFEQYRAFVIILFLIGVLPVVVVGLFGSLAFRNVQQMTYRTVPLVRRELEKQITTMVLVQVIVNSIPLLTYTTVSAVATKANLSNDPSFQAKLQVAINISLIFYYSYFSSSFYIYICASERFRQQLIYVLFTMHRNRWRQPRIANNQIIPDIR